MIYGYGITPTASEGDATDDDDGAFSATSPNWTGRVVTISTGSATVEKAVSVPAHNIAVNLANQPIFSMIVDVKGEPVSVSQMAFNVTLTGDNAAGDVDDITNATMFDENGTVVAGPVDGSEVGEQQSGTLAFSDTVTFPIGRNTYTIKAKMGTQLTNGVTVAASTTPSGWSSPKGTVTGNTVSLQSTAVTGNTMTVKTAALEVSVGSQPVA